MLVALTLVSGAAMAAADAKLSASDKSFVMKAANGGLAEVKMGQLAVDKGTSQTVKQYGQKMVDDHTKANNELKAFADKRGITVPADISGEERVNYDKLAKLSGEKFDKAYIKCMVKDHDADVAEFKKEANGGKDPELKAWAAQTLPTLQQHQQMAHDNQKM